MFFETDVLMYLSVKRSMVLLKGIIALKKPVIEMFILLKGRYFLTRFLNLTPIRYCLVICYLTHHGYQN